MSLKAAALALVIVAVPAAAHAVTLRDIIELSRAGVPDAILVALIDADQTMFALEPAQVLQLRNAHVSDTVVLKMLATRRAFEPAAAPSSTVAPILVITGAGPRLPETPIVNEFVMPYPVIVEPSDRHPSRGRPAIHRRPPAPDSINVGWPIRNGEFVTLDADRRQAAHPDPATSPRATEAIGVPRRPASR